jgi:hypothetical protein
LLSSLPFKFKHSGFFFVCAVRRASGASTNTKKAVWLLHAHYGVTLRQVYMPRLGFLRRGYLSKRPPGSAAGAAPPKRWVLAFFVLQALVVAGLFYNRSITSHVRKFLPLAQSSIASSFASAVAQGSRKQLVRDRCPWSALAWDAPHTLIRWSSTTNFTSVDPRAPTLDGVLELHIEGCDLGWVTQRTARQCMASLGHVVFAGDSVSRLRFMSLTHFLHTGSWSPLDKDHPPSDAPRAWAVPDPADPTLFSLDIHKYLRVTNARMGGTEACDCHIGAYHTENRYYREAGVTLSYATHFSHGHGLRLHRMGYLNTTCPLPPCQQAGCAVGGCTDEASPNARDFMFLQDGQDLEALVDVLLPDLLVLNVGHHASMDTEAGIGEVRALARRMAQGEGERARQRLGFRGGPQYLGLRGDFEKAWNAFFDKQSPAAALEGGPASAGNTSAGSSSGGGSGSGGGAARNFVWRTTSPRREADGVWAAVLSKKHIDYPGAPVLGKAPAAPRGPWPSIENGLVSSVKEEGGRVFDDFTLLWPLTMLAHAEGRPETIAALFAHPLDSLHHSPGVNSQVNRALLSFLCENEEVDF